MYLHERDRFVRCPVYDRYALGPGARVKGPALIEEAESTVVLGAEFDAVVDRQGNLVASRRKTR
jgi:N-methylhydantoinase A